MWEFPKRTPKANNVLDPLDFVEGYVPYVNTLGRLGAHNFAGTISGELNTNTDLADDVHRRVGYVTVERDDDDRSVATQDVINRMTVQVMDVWLPVTQLTMVFSSRGGTLDIHTDVQFMRTPDNGNHTRSISYIQLGIMVDGTLIPESVIGDLDYAQSGQGMEVGMSGLAFGGCCSVRVPVTAGFHEVTTAVRVVPRIKHYSNGVLPYNMNTLNENDAEEYGAYFLGSRNLLVVEDS